MAEPPLPELRPLRSLSPTEIFPTSVIQSEAMDPSAKPQCGAQTITGS
jgi:hypothetical protein